ncbi:hypothetical protein H072_2439 [Dactylellina haptotyla CBS 200.50]|uniref:Uncharacterized protein n=1 Tax=Dactylellina haptotyla (strain CBS 200.50) TaxID=1284197 RepID=S8AKY8_DACHA|nr:hypothetical protein H072_2439 [Dactylellina haptotyla CBS 200.50]
MDLLSCPNEVLMQILSYFDHDLVTTYECNYESDYDNIEPGSINENSSSNLLPTIAVEKIDRGFLFDLRLVCRRLEQIATPLAFRVIRLCRNFEHTQKAIEKLDNHSDDPLVVFVRHITISSISLIPRAYKMEVGDLIDENGKGFAEAFNARATQWARILIKDLRNLFPRLPPSLVEITITEMNHENVSKSCIPILNNIFFVALSLAFENCDSSQIQKTNIYAQLLIYVDILSTTWAEGQRHLTTFVHKYRSKALRKRVPPIFQGVKDVCIFTNKFIPLPGDTLLPETIRNVTIRCPYRFDMGTACSLDLTTKDLDSLVLEGLGSFFPPSLLSPKVHPNLSKVHIYILEAPLTRDYKNTLMENERSHNDDDDD